MDARTAKRLMCHYTAWVLMSARDSGSYLPDTISDEDADTLTAAAEELIDELMRRAGEVAPKAAAKNRAAIKVVKDPAEYEREVRELNAAMQRGRPYNVRRLIELREMDVERFTALADDERARAIKALNPFA